MLNFLRPYLALLVALPLLAACAMFSADAPEEEAKAIPAPPAELQVVWGVDVDQRKPREPFSFSMPALAGGLIVIGGQDRYAHVYNPQGSELRRVPLQAPSDSGALAFSDSLVVLGDAQGVLYGIDPQQGTAVWQRPLPSVMLGHPVRVDGDILVQTADNSLYRISAQGEKRWSYSGAQAGLGMHLTPSPMVAGDIVFMMLGNGDAVALHSDTGNIVWRRQLLLDNEAVVLGELKAPLADPVLIGEVLVVSLYQGNLIALSARDGQQLWQRSISLKSTPLTDQGRLFAATAGGAVVEIDSASGATLWKRQLDAGELVGPGILDRRLIVADDRGQVFAMDMNGTVHGSVSLPGRVDRPPVRAPDGMLLRTNLGGLYLIR